MIKAQQSTTLICTVGGSYEPIVCAIQSTSPDFVCFICSVDDPATGNKGSYQQIEGRGNVIKQVFSDIKPTLPNILVQMSLTEEQYTILYVEPDNIDDICSKISQWLRERDPLTERFIADYTGGTKSMSAALVVVALDDEHIGLQLVTGSRNNLVKVASGSETVVPAAIEASRLQRRQHDALSVWSRYAYAEAADLLTKIPSPRDTHQRGQLQRALDISLAFSAWDRFDHHLAEKILLRYRNKLGNTHSELYNILGKLNQEGPAQEPMRLLDLYRNAQRRAATHRYDDAIARLYRLTEWAGQWLLRERANISTDNVAEDKIPPGLQLSRNREGNFQAGLFSTWELLAHYGDQSVRDFWVKNKNHLLNHLQTRNYSILAHGFTPLNESAWLQFLDWVDSQLLPVLFITLNGNKKYKIKNLPRQLPEYYQYYD